MNEIKLMGRIVTDVKKRNEKAPCEFKVETRDEWRGEKVEGKNNNQYHPVAVWGEKGNWAIKNLKRNDIVEIVGILQHKKVEFQATDKDKNFLSNKDGSPVMVSTSVSEIKVKIVRRLGSADRPQNDPSSEPQV